MWFVFIVEPTPCGWGWTSLACQGFLVREAYINVLVGGARSLSLGCNEVSSSEFWGVFGFGVTFGRLYFNAQDYVSALKN